MSYSSRNEKGFRSPGTRDLHVSRQIRDLETRVAQTRTQDLAKIEFASYHDVEMVAPTPGTIFLHPITERAHPMHVRALSLTISSTDEVESASLAAALYAVEKIEDARDPLDRSGGVLSDFNPVSALPGVTLRLLTPPSFFERRVIQAPALTDVNSVFRFVRDVVIDPDQVVFLALWASGTLSIQSSVISSGRFRATQRSVRGTHTFPEWPATAQMVRPPAGASTPLPCATVLSSRGVVAYGGWGIE